MTDNVITVKNNNNDKYKVVYIYIIMVISVNYLHSIADFQKNKRLSTNCIYSFFFFDAVNSTLKFSFPFICLYKVLWVEIENWGHIFRVTTGYKRG